MLRCSKRHKVCTQRYTSSIIVRITADESTDVLLHIDPLSSFIDLAEKYRLQANLHRSTKFSFVLPDDSLVHSDCTSTLVDKGISMGDRIMVIMANNNACVGTADNMDISMSIPSLNVSSGGILAQTITPREYLSRECCRHRRHVGLTR